MKLFFINLIFLYTGTMLFSMNKSLPGNRFKKRPVIPALRIVEHSTQPTEQKQKPSTETTGKNPYAIWKIRNGKLVLSEELIEHLKNEPRPPSK